MSLWSPSHGPTTCLKLRILPLLLRHQTSVPHPCVFYIPLGMMTLPPPWAARSNSWPLFQQKNISWYPTWTSPDSFRLFALVLSPGRSWLWMFNLVGFTSGFCLFCLSLLHADGITAALSSGFRTVHANAWIQRQRQNLVFWGLFAVGLESQVLKLLKGNETWKKWRKKM